MLRLNLEQFRKQASAQSDPRSRVGRSDHVKPTDVEIRDVFLCGTDVVLLLTESKNEKKRGVEITLAMSINLLQTIMNDIVEKQSAVISRQSEDIVEKQNIIGDQEFEIQQLKDKIETQEFEMMEYK